jgi:hypothetical protein
MAANPSLQEILLKLKTEGMITEDDQFRYMENYKFFNRYRVEIKREFLHKWVAALNKEIYSEMALSALNLKIKDKPDYKYAYIERVI